MITEAARLFDLLIFDLDGTLVDSRWDIATAVNITLDDLGAPRRTPDDIFSFIGGGVHNLMLKSLPAGAAGSLEKAVDLFWDNYKYHVLDTTKTFPGVDETLERLSSKTMAVATNKPCAHTKMILHGLGLSRYFISVQGWKEGRAVKPDPQILLVALDESGVPPEKAVMIGDGTSDVLAARAAGVKSCAVGYGYGDRDKVLAASPDYYVEDIRELVGLFGG